MKIIPIPESGDCRTGTLSDVTVQDINKVLGFTPNVQDDPCKVEFSWGFTADGIRCGIWDYKGSAAFRSFSTFGPRKVFESLFPGKVSP